MIKAVIFGTGHVGCEVLEALRQTDDFEICGIISRSRAGQYDGDVPIVGAVEQLPPVDIAILAVPSRLTPDLAGQLLQKGISTADSFDIHNQIPEVWERLNKTARQNGARAVVAAGWDPGTDSVVRTLMEAMAPVGITYTNFGPGMSMGHTVAVKAIEGVAEALSITIPTGFGIHRRMVYIELKGGYMLETVAEAIKKDPYFIHDETHVVAVSDVKALRDMGHGVKIERGGVSGVSPNQNFSFGMRINNPALTAQIMVCSARAVLKQDPGCYTLIELPPVDFLPGDRRDAIARLV